MQHAICTDVCSSRVLPTCTTTWHVLLLLCRYNAWNYTRLDSSGQFIRHTVPLGDVAVHYRGGSIIPMQPYANLTKVVRYTHVTLVVTIPAHPSGTPGAPLPPYANEEACAAVHAAHAGHLVSCGVLFMDTPDDTDITPGNSVEVSHDISHAVTTSSLVTTVLS
jgi:hypothetical protein